ncbi:TfoX/Sxy family transcriptional regulator of competence genes [Knoellia remsis]|uniref:TfoX/Sxy family transcriptional regulator of competence genes n=2 Tax=Knoellia remsis TaxID=407159 RepID=A0A2T0UH08_9MICO|nr:TfoX/Sxy family transcriptional regulator of competence genes [Knoellia remsis]
MPGVPVRGTMARMAYDEVLAQRVREIVGGDPDVTERKMFGGLGFMFGGSMGVAAASRGALMVRVDPEESEALTARAGVERMEMKGRSMAGWLLVDQSVLEGDAALEEWVERGADFARSLPPKE